MKQSLSRTIQTLRGTINANIGVWGKDKPKFMMLAFKENILEYEIVHGEFRQL